MNKKYQVFVSSTYKDLQEARAKVRDAILSMYHFPVGMELFGAANEEQWQIISETIDSSDYYVEYAKLHQTLRIIAHFVLFCIFGMLLEAAIIVSSCHPSMLKSCFPALLICTVISIIPEVVKLWIPGRHLQWDEVLLNIIGAYGGVFMIALGMKKRKRNDDTSLK